MIRIANLASKNPLTIYANAGVPREDHRQAKVNIVHARSRAPAWSALWAARRMKIPFVTTYHGVYNAKSSLKRLVQLGDGPGRHGDRQF